MNRILVKALSVNVCYQGRRFKNKAYKQYEHDVLSQLKPMRLPEIPFSVYYEFGLSSKNADLDNHIKCFQDILQTFYHFNDKNIYNIVAVKIDVAKTKEYIKFDIQHFE